ncbi:AlpA family transcriptional regulator [Salmonella enterica]|uniref:AlpA family transcriptional regulator n=3 Tax=Enterobacteriaceae TaxID=543 RepID=A0A8F7NAQ9_SALER|nr:MULTISPECIES: AlpA family transcriptional regulator [Citrobacter]EBJ7483093.1 AlpA family transcriptional regulator [Salmonella enterica]ECI4529088.1 AlpA family transcriptional regulator [Salmonella enterica subsp. diarizonae]EDV4943751.1 AlpA family transcriptional regulator [Salmonella enterica subsp. arizonae]HCV7537768.1 AlpA family transcriptional regulator [Salmonella enterica subsp. arizonae serovar 48:z4,z23:-]EBP0190625.1 AlpA family transcriptional regulator [Salmonella enterica]
MHTVSSVPPSPTGTHLMPVSAPVQERFLRLPEVIHQCGLSRSTLYDLIARNAFPAQVSLGGKNVAWLQSEITAWMAERVAHRNRKYDA